MDGNRYAILLRVEYWRKTLEEQCIEMNIGKESFSGRLYGFSFEIKDDQENITSDVSSRTT